MLFVFRPEKREADLKDCIRWVKVMAVVNEMHLSLEPEFGYSNHTDCTVSVRFLS